MTTQLRESVDYEVACCDICGSSDPDMSKHEKCMEQIGTWYPLYEDEDE